MKTLYKSAFLIFCILSLSWPSSSAQERSISGQIIREGTPLSYATIILKTTADSSLVKAEISDLDGRFFFTSLPLDTFFIEASYVGLERYFSPPIIPSQSTLILDPITLDLRSTQLSEVEIIAQKPLIEIQPDKTIFNVEGSINTTGNDGFELLRKLPGVMIDNNEYIILDGKPGVQIYIDHKPALLAGSDLVNYLRSLQASDIESIELITQPSSKYDAAGNAGIIDIILKRDKSLGLNGTANAGYAYGKNSRYNTSLSFNQRTRKMNLFGNYGYSRGKRWSFLYLDRIQQNVRYDSETETVQDNDNHNIRLGLDMFPSENHTVGLLFQANIFDNQLFKNTTTPIIPLSEGTINQTLIANNEGINDNKNLSGNINYRYEDTVGHEFQMDIDYATYEREAWSFQPNQYFEGDRDNFLFERNFRMVTPTDISIFSVKTDYSQPFWGGELGLGAKYSHVQTDNVFQFFNLSSGRDQLDEERSNRFLYLETIIAAYANFSKKWKKWNAQLGLRIEQTISDGNLISTQQLPLNRVKRSYLNLFPSGGLTYQYTRQNSWALTYSRRIQRPNYQSLNPFETQLDELSFARGNPFLQPQYTHNLKLSHTYKYRLTTSISYSFIQDYFAQITDTLGETRNFLITRNIANQEVWNVGISYPFQAYKWWNVYLSLNAYHASYTAQDDRFQAINQATASLYAQNTFNLPKKIQLEISGWFSSPSVWGGTYLTKSMGSLNVGVQRKFWDDRLSAKLTVNDIFFTSPWVADMSYGGIYISGTGGWESRQLRFTLSYAFGSSELKAARKRKTGLAEENNRVGN